MPAFLIDWTRRAPADRRRSRSPSGRGWRSASSARSAPLSGRSRSRASTTILIGTSRAETREHAVDTVVERGHAGHALQHPDRVACLQHAGEPLAGELAALEVVGGDDRVLPSQAGMSLSIRTTLTPGLDRLVQRRDDGGLVGVIAMPLTPLATMYWIAAISPASSVPLLPCA